MECLMANHTTKRTFKIHHKKNIGTVVFVVEGAVDEFDLLYKIFHKLLHYRVMMAKRNSSRIKTYTDRISSGNTTSTVVIMNVSGSNIKSVHEHDQYRTKIYEKLITEYNIDPKNVPIYYLWDRDPESNDHTKTRTLIHNLGSAYGNGEWYENGLLLLNYPALESYKLSCSKDKKRAMICSSVKDIKKSVLYRVQPTSHDKLVVAARSMHDAIIELGAICDRDDYNTDQFSDTNIKIFNKEEGIYKKQSGYRVLSLLTIALIDLGIIEVC